MIDLKLLRNNPEKIKQAIENKNEKIDIDKVISLDEDYRKTRKNFDNKKSIQNKISKEIAQLIQIRTCFLSDKLEN